MAWTPDNPALYENIDDLFENQSFSKSLSYVDESMYPGEVWQVTISASEENSTINIADDTISGYYSGAFPGFSLYYQKTDNSYATITKWDDLTDTKEIISFRPSSVQTKLFTYTATAISDLTQTEVTQDFTILLTNSWDVGRANLIAAVAETVARKS